MKNTFNGKNSYLMSCIYIILILMAFCYFGINYTIKGTWAGFGGLSGCLAPTINITYLPNYPNDIEEPEIVTKLTCNQYLIDNIMYEVPVGYEFIGWDTNEDGSGNRYLGGSIISLESDINLYAQWNLISDEQDGDSNMGDSDSSSDDNLSGDGSLDKDDPPVSDDTIDNGDDSQGNGDDLGDDSDSSSDGDGSDIENDNNNLDDSEDNSHHNSSSNQNSSNNGNASIDKKPGNNNETNNVLEKVYYNFKFIYNNKEYASSMCEVLDDGTCLMLIPGINPVKNGYVFSGWSLNKDCPSKEIITSSVSVDNSNTYYACFIKIANNKTSVNFVTVGITVFVIWVVALTLIYCIVKWFKKKENNN